ncbi:hypothetical protein J5N97_021314 [Dioscorea zingiberensis]|uniref:Peptidase metallopeptidase domain-containing protein n=1 Tax=Dioscorea zingiberensis TaxID=325984 RepID=A0A9D5CI05_9LILI|nr:hypothetical protein J5N97_021314 [Dioscorea zingiberensis]
MWGYFFRPIPKKPPKWKILHALKSLFSDPHMPGEYLWERPLPMTITYTLFVEHTVDYISREEILAIIQRAASRWSQHIPVNFVEMKNSKAVDLKIWFYRNAIFDKDPGKLVFSTGYEPRHMHINASKHWVKNSEGDWMLGSDIYLEWALAHELGHTLFLRHLPDKDALMYGCDFEDEPRMTKGFTLKDIEYAQKVYGRWPLGLGPAGNLNCHPCMKPLIVDLAAFSLRKPVPSKQPAGNIAGERARVLVSLLHA